METFFQAKNFSHDQKKKKNFFLCLREIFFTRKKISPLWLTVKERKKFKLIKFVVKDPRGKLGLTWLGCFHVKEKSSTESLLFGFLPARRERERDT
jgi:hypothetical protein